MTYDKGSTIKLSENFEAKEFDCKCKNKSCKTTEIDPKLIEILQKIRTHFGKSVTVNSSYRCEAHNKSVGGAKSSRHLTGQAADIKVSGVSPKEVAKYAESIGVKGIGLYDTFVHVDTRTTKSFWYSNAQEYRSTFGGTPIVEETKPEEKVEEPGKYAQITATSVNIRKGPGTEFATAGTAKKGTKYKIVEIPEKWIPVEINGEVRFISSTYAKKV